MFTGIIEELGTVEQLAPRPAGARLTVFCHEVLSDLLEGASIAVNGVCLTAVDLRHDSFSADLSPETLERSNLGTLRVASVVNLERPLSSGGRLGGHLVQGHIDGTGEFVSLQALGAENSWLKVRVPSELERYIVAKGSIAIDGISLTVAAVEDSLVSATIVPHTLRNTALQVRRPGDRVNIECDILAKYIEKMLAAYSEKRPKLTLERLHELGY